MKHRAAPAFWHCYRRVPASVRAIADRSFQLLLEDPAHPSLHLKQIGRLWAVRVGLRYRALGVQSTDSILWFWIGTHAEYDRLVGPRSRIREEAVDRYSATAPAGRSACDPASAAVGQFVAVEAVAR